MRLEVKDPDALVLENHREIANSSAADSPLNVYAYKRP
ncbi:hypothetical protein T4D_8706 [Trichinella pseudospiralis]|uniref:Uncharacterized protein n=1 Tax=Trichinella pseudospiralis TaxID=6337 RepID=A0A0V1G4B8_TRIPS|nr:hypothetical protein T4D_8706 [Trichinella pseudospiralis]